LFVPATKLRIFQQNPQFFFPHRPPPFLPCPRQFLQPTGALLLYIRKIIYFLGFFSSMFFVGEEEMTVSQTMQNSKVLSMDVAGNSFFTPPFPDCISTKRPTLRFLNFSFL
jgi:hypothetical protein